MLYSIVQYTYCTYYSTVYRCLRTIISFMFFGCRIWYGDVSARRRYPSSECACMRIILSVWYIFFIRRHTYVDMIYTSWNFRWYAQIAQSIVRWIGKSTCFRRIGIAISVWAWSLIVLRLSCNSVIVMRTWGLLLMVITGLILSGPSLVTTNALYVIRSFVRRVG